MKAYESIFYFITCNKQNTGFQPAIKVTGNSYKDSNHSISLSYPNDLSGRDVNERESAILLLYRIHTLYVHNITINNKRLRYKKRMPSTDISESFYYYKIDLLL